MPSRSRWHNPAARAAKTVAALRRLLASIRSKPLDAVAPRTLGRIVTLVIGIPLPRLGSLARAGQVSADRAGSGVVTAAGEHIDAGYMLAAVARTWLERQSA